jgi:L-alanine-DL-glutamate epimerase-like enolase superfamily enzyme
MVGLKIDDVHIRTRVLERRDAGWQTSSYRASEVLGLYVGIEVEGGLGVGASAAHPRSLPPSALVEQAEAVLRPALVGRPLYGIQARLAATTGLHGRTRLAADLALHDLLGKRAGVPAEVLWGGPVRRRVGVIRMIGLKEPEAVVDAVAPLHDEGYRAFKIKIGDGVDRDAERLRRVRSAFGADVVLTADANGHYSLADALVLCDRLAELGLFCLEQPLDYADRDGMATLRRATSVPLMADQSVASAEDAARVAASGAADLIAVKLTKMGSVAETARAICAAAAHGVQAYLGGSAAPGIVDSALTRLALTRPDIAPYAEVAEGSALVDDQVGGSTVAGGWATSDLLPGLGGRPTVFDR